MKKVYLDNGSTAFPKAPGVGEAMSEFILKVGCNIGRGGYDRAYSLAEKIAETRSLLCKLFNFQKESHVVFTPSVTYSLNFVIKGLLKAGDHVIISSMEHNAVARPCESLKKQGVEVSIAKCDLEGKLDFDHFGKLFQENTKLVVMSHASNVCGTVQDAEKIGKVCKEKQVKFVLDAAQSAGVVPIDFEQFNLAALCVTGHKGLLGPQGVGALLLSDEMAEMLEPVIDGGTGSASHLLTMPNFMPDKFEVGTLNLPGIIGLNAALTYLDETGIASIYEREQKLVELFLGELKEMSGITVVGKSDSHLRTGIVSLDFKKMDNAEVAYLLDEQYGIMVRCGLHCAPLAHQTLGTYPHGTVRFAFGHATTEEEVRYAVKAIREMNGIDIP
ncbi:cysteine desulfurase family protein [Clostridiales Family XIII bacterium PM5-7]